MAQFNGNFDISNGSGTYTVKVLRCSDSVQQGSTVTLSGQPTSGTISYTVSFSALGFSENYKVEVCDGGSCFQTGCVNLTCCNPITSVTINGATTGMAGQSSTYSVSFNSGADSPSSYVWSISGQGTGFLSGNTGSTATFQFGTSGNATVYLDVVDCTGNTRSASLSVDQQQASVSISNITITGTC